MFSKLTRVSPAMGVAMIALVLSLGGTSFAQGAASKLGKLISGSKIKRGSIPGDRLVKGGVPGDRIKSNSITGKQINEKTLGTVPSATRAQRVTLADRATNAQRATNADNALALGGTAAAGYVSFAGRGIPSGTTVTGRLRHREQRDGDRDDDRRRPRRPHTHDAPDRHLDDRHDQRHQAGRAAAGNRRPRDLSNGTVNFAAGGADADPSCSGTATAPTAPAGKVCLYLSSAAGTGTAVDGQAIPGLAGSRSGFVVHATNATLGETGAFGTWAYTAP